MLQSSAWARVKAGRGWQLRRIHVAVGSNIAMAQVLFRRVGPLRVGYIPRGPLVVGDACAVMPSFECELNKLARRMRAVSIIIEPDQDLPHLRGFDPGPVHIQPERTVKVPLLDDMSMLADMHQKTRYNIRHAERLGVRIRRGDVADIPLFFTLLEDTSARNGFAIHPQDYYGDVLTSFGNRAGLFFAERGNCTTAALMVVCFGTEAVYLYGGSSTDLRQSGETALLQFSAMQWAREQGCAYYDLWGIPAADPDIITTHGGRHQKSTHGNDLTGLYRFKTGFGGSIISLPDTLEKSYIPLVPRAFRLVSDFMRSRR